MDAFTTEELQRLAEALTNGEGRSVNEQETVDFVLWAQDARLGAILLEGVLSGGLDVKKRDGQYAFKVAAYDHSLARDTD